MFHPSWHMCIYKRMFESENKTLAKESVIHFLEIWQRKCLPSSQGFSEVRFIACPYKILFINPLKQGPPTPKVQSGSGPWIVWNRAYKWWVSTCMQLHLHEQWASVCVWSSICMSRVHLRAHCLHKWSCSCILAHHSCGTLPSLPLRCHRYWFTQPERLGTTALKKA